MVTTKFVSFYSNLKLYPVCISKIFCDKIGMSAILDSIFNSSTLILVTSQSVLAK